MEDLKEKYNRMLTHGIDIDDLGDDYKGILFHLMDYLEEASEGSLKPYFSDDSEISVAGKHRVVVMKIKIKNGTLLFKKERFEDPEFFLPLIKDDIMSLIVFTLSFLKEVRDAAEKAEEGELDKESSDKKAEDNSKDDDDDSSEDMWL